MILFKNLKKNNLIYTVPSVKLVCLKINDNGNYECICKYRDGPKNMQVNELDVNICGINI